jgi:hypothetical protein
MPNDRATLEALKRAGEYIAAFLRRASPSADASEAWRIESRGDVVYLRNRDLGAWATALNKRHPLFAGPRNPAGRDHWYATNQRSPERTNWDARALELAADEAARRFGDEWVKEIARQSDIWEVR